MYWRSYLTMTLIPEEDILQKEIELWKGFADSLRHEDRQIFQKMLDECYKYQQAINAKGKPFPSEALLMGLLFIQHKMINWSIKNRK